MEEEILTFDNLYESAQKCKSGVIWKGSVAHFILNGIEEVFKLFKELSEGTYKERKHKEFYITEPKRRKVLSIAFRDRVYQRTLNDLVLYPIMTNNFILGNCACQKKKGTDFARNLLKKYMRNYYQCNKSNSGYIIHIDIKKYYDSMDHKLCEELFKKRLPKDIYARVHNCLKDYTEASGYYPGSQMVQILGIAFLNTIDHFIKEKLIVKYYVRYIDDMMLVVKDNPQVYIDSIRAELNKINLDINTEKTKYSKLYKGEVFLGFKFYITDSGKVLQILSNKNIKRRRKKLIKLAQKATRKEFENSFQTWYSYASRGDNKQEIKKVKQLYDKLLEETIWH